MEEMSEKQNPPLESKAPDEGGIRRRLRDRDLLRKRKAEAEEKATNQWVYGAQSRRKRARREEKRGRPKKSDPGTEPQPIREEAQPEAPSVEEDTLAPQNLPVLPALLSMTPQPAEPQPVPVEQVSTRPLEEFLIEDLGPDEEEDLPPPGEDLVSDQGTIEEPPTNVSEQNNVFSIPMFASPPPPQQEYLPGNVF